MLEASGLLAKKPADFANSSGIEAWDHMLLVSPFSMTDVGLYIRLRRRKSEDPLQETIQFALNYSAKGVLSKWRVPSTAVHARPIGEFLVNNGRPLQG